MTPVKTLYIAENDDHPVTLQTDKDAGDTAVTAYTATDEDGSLDGAVVWTLEGADKDSFRSLVAAC